MNDTIYRMEAIYAIGAKVSRTDGLIYCFESVGAKAIWASEIEEFPIAVTKERFPEE